MDINHCTWKVRGKVGDNMWKWTINISTFNRSPIVSANPMFLFRLGEMGRGWGNSRGAKCSFLFLGW